jgi:hypothetical protein
VERFAEEFEPREGPHRGEDMRGIRALLPPRLEEPNRAAVHEERV